MSKRALKSQWSMLLLTGWFDVPREARKPQDWRMIYNDHDSDAFVMRFPSRVKPGDKRYIIAAADMQHFGVYESDSDDLHDDTKKMQYVTYGPETDAIDE